MAWARKIVSDARLGQPEVADLAFFDQLTDGAGNVLDRHIGVDAVLVEQVDVVGPQPLQGGVRYGSDVFGAGVQACGATLDAETEFSGDDDLISNRFQGLSDEFLIDIRAEPSRPLGL